MHNALVTFAEGGVIMCRCFSWGIARRCYRTRLRLLRSATRRASGALHASSFGP